MATAVSACESTELSFEQKEESISEKVEQSPSTASSTVDLGATEEWKYAPFIDESSKNVIQGFLRIILEQFFWKMMDNPYYTIPPLIYRLCLIYWYEGTDQFNTYRCGDRIKISADALAVHYNGDSQCRPCSVYGSKAIPSMMDRIYIWTFTINGFERRGFNLGIADSESKVLDWGFDIEREMVQYNLCLTGSLWSYKGFVGKQPMSVQKGDTLRMELKLSHKGSTLKYYLKGGTTSDFSNCVCDSKKHKMAIERKPGLHYRLAITMSNEGNALGLIDFEEIPLKGTKRKQKNSIEGDNMDGDVNVESARNEGTSRSSRCCIL